MINVAQILRDCQIDRVVKRVVRQRQIDQTVYLICVCRDGRWVFVDRCLEPASFDAIFAADEAAAIAWAPKAVQRGWT